MLGADLTEDKKDAKWAEGYTYFRCAAGLFDPSFATYVEKNFNPLKNSFPSDNKMYCGIAEKMHTTSDLGYGVNMKDLGTGTFDATKMIADECGLEGELGSGKTDGDGGSHDSHDSHDCENSAS